MKILITGVAGFIGYSVAARMLKLGHSVIGLDKERDARRDKEPRLQNLAQFEKFKLITCDLSNYGETRATLSALDYDIVIHMSGQYSVAYSTPNLLAFIDGNLRSFLHVMDCTKQKGISRVIYASSTFVQDGVLPTSMYGATLEFRERAASVYSAMGLETIGLRFGSTYGPYIRPDVGVYQLARKLCDGTPINVTLGGFGYTSGMCYIADAVDVVQLCVERPAEEKHQMFTVVAHEPVVSLGHILQIMEQHTGLTANRVGAEPHVERGYTPTAKLEPMAKALGYIPSTSIEAGIAKFMDWYVPRHKAGKP